MTQSVGVPDASLGFMSDASPRLPHLYSQNHRKIVKELRAYVEAISGAHGCAGCSA